MNGAAHAPCTAAVDLRLDARLWDRLGQIHLRPGKRHESLTYLWARCERIAGGLAILLPRDTPLFAFGPDCYARRGSAHLRLSPDVLNGMLVEFAASEYTCLVNVHDHWFCDEARFSPVDDEDDCAFDHYLRERYVPMLRKNPAIGRYRDIYNLSIVLARKSVAARLTDVTAELPFRNVRHITLLGRKWRRAPLSRARDTSAETHPPRNVRHEGFLSAEEQHAISDLHVAIVGCGGLGSILTESLVRLGVRRLTLIDGERLEVTNLNRWQGAHPSDVGRHKVFILSDRVRQWAPECLVRAVAHPLAHSRSLLAVAAADIIIGGLDEDAPRYLLNHLAVQHLQPYFDAGVAIERRPEVDFCSRYFLVLPGVTGCVECKTFSLIDRDKVVQALAHPATAAARRAAGYVLDEPDVPASSAYALNQRAAGMLVQELLNFVAGWRPVATVICERWRSGRMDRADRENYPEIPASDCSVCSVRMGHGSTLTLPGLRRDRSVP